MINNEAILNELFSFAYDVEELADTFHTTEQHKVLFNLLLNNEIALNKLFSDSSYFKIIAKIFSPLADAEKIFKRSRESEPKISSSTLGFFNQNDLELNSKKRAATQ